MKSHAFIGYFFEYSFVIIVTLRKSFILSSSLIMLFYLEVYLEVFIWKFLASNDQDLLVFTPWEVPSHRHQGGSVRTLEYRGHSDMSLPSLGHKGYCGLHCSYLSLYWNTLGEPVAVWWGHMSAPSWKSCQTFQSCSPGTCLDFHLMENYEPGPPS